MKLTTDSTVLEYGTAAYGSDLRNRGQLPELDAPADFGGGNPALFTDGTAFKVVNVNSVPAAAIVGSKPGVTVNGAGAATDGHQAQSNTIVNLLPGKVFRIYTEFVLNDVGASTGNEFAFGLASAGLSAGMIATVPNELLVLRKLKTEAGFKLIAKSASGQTAESVVINHPALVAGTRYAVELLIRPDPITQKAGLVTVYFGTANRGGQQYESRLKNLGDYKLSLQVPLPTVALSVLRAFRQGSTSTSTGVHLGRLAWVGASL